MEWQPITTAPFDRYLELAVINYDASVTKPVFFLDQQLEHREAGWLVHAVLKFAAKVLDVLSGDELVHAVAFPSRGRGCIR